MNAKKCNTRCGMVSIVGRPNVGKSTLLNRIVGEKVAIVTKVPQTTRNQIRGIYNDQRGQIIFIDTPGLHIASDRLGKFMNNASLATTPDADCIIHLVDANKPTGKEEQMVLQRLSEVRVPIILALNKIDTKGKCADEYIRLWQETRGDSIHDTDKFIIMPVSGKSGHNIDVLIDMLFEKVPHGAPLYPIDIISDVPRKIVIADIIREKLLDCMRDEIPHSLAVLIEEILPKRNKVMYISARIVVDKETHKEIVIGKKGNVLKRVGSFARKDLENLLERRIYLDLRVVLKPKWRDNSQILSELGYASE